MGLLINYFSNATEVVVQWATPSCSRPHPAEDNGLSGDRSNQLAVTPTVDKVVSSESHLNRAYSSHKYYECIKIYTYVSQYIQKKIHRAKSIQLYGTEYNLYVNIKSVSLTLVFTKIFRLIEKHTIKCIHRKHAVELIYIYENPKHADDILPFTSTRKCGLWSKTQVLLGQLKTVNWKQPCVNAKSVLLARVAPSIYAKS